jgi:peptide/nickel transport system ATP-binding protein
VVEQAGVEEILHAPKQAYTKRLIGAVPRGWQPAASAAA